MKTSIVLICKRNFKHKITNAIIFKKGEKYNITDIVKNFYKTGNSYLISNFYYSESFTKYYFNTISEIRKLKLKKIENAN